MRYEPNFSKLCRGYAVDVGASGADHHCKNQREPSFPSKEFQVGCKLDLGSMLFHWRHTST